MIDAVFGLLLQFLDPRFEISSKLVNTGKLVA